MWQAYLNLYGFLLHGILETYGAVQGDAKGLICLSACIVGDIPKLILARRFDEAEKLALRLKEMFKEE